GDRPHPRGRLRRDGHPLPGRARPGRRAAGRAAEPRDLVRRGSRREGHSSTPRVAPRTPARDRHRTGGNGRRAMSKQFNRLVGWSACALLVSVLAVAAAGCGGGGGGSKSASTQVKGLGSTLAEIKSKARTEGQVDRRAL